MQQFNYSIEKIENGVLLYKSELNNPIKIVYYESFDLALQDLQMLLNTNFMILGQAYLDTNQFTNLTIEFKND